MKITSSVFGGLTLLAGLLMTASAHAFLTKPVQLPPLHPGSRIIVSQERELDRETSAKIIAEINASRVGMCTEFSGKANQPERSFRVRQPNAIAATQFALRHDEIVQLKAGLTSGGFSCRLDIGKNPNLKALLESASD